MRTALTIDTEHPDRATKNPIGNLRAILDLLRERGVRATFFVQGKWALANPELAKAVVDEEHLLGNHSHSHCAFENLTDEGIAAELEQSRAVLDSISPTGRLFRLPGGNGKDDKRIRDAVELAGYEHVDWTCEGDDWRGIPPLQIANTIISAVRSSIEPSVSLLHSWPDATPGALEILLDALVETAECVGLDQLDPEEIPRGTNLNNR